jgi:flagellar assembly protein FliH
MPSSRDSAAALAWVPEDFGTSQPVERRVADRRQGDRRQHDRRASDQRADVVNLFEVSSTPAGVPDMLLAPARAAAENEGYIAGWNRGHELGRQEAAAEARIARQQAEHEAAAVVAELNRATDALANAARAVQAHEITSAESVEQLIVAAAFRIAEALVGVTLADDARRGPAAVARALALAPRGEAVTVALHPADVALLPDTSAYGSDVEIVADPSLRPGDAYARVGATTIDARIAAGVERVRDLLDPAAS